MDQFFSVIIPSYNSELYVGDAIESALCQAGVTFEVIVVNDGSTDGTRDVLASFGQNIKIVDQANMGISGARNSGAMTAQGNYLAFLDADDIWLPGKLSAQSRKIKEGYQVVYTNRFNFGQISDLPEIQSDVVKMKGGDIWEDLLFGNMITASSSIISTELYKSLGGFRNELRSCEDWDLWLRCSEKCPIGYCSEPLLKYRIHPGSLSRNYRFMSMMREQVVLAALHSERGRTLSWDTKRKISARAWASSGWDAAQGKNIACSMKYYGKSLCIWPFDTSVWYDVARALAGRI